VFAECPSNSGRRRLLNVFIVVARVVQVGTDWTTILLPGGFVGVQLLHFVLPFTNFTRAMHLEFFLVNYYIICIVQNLT
jgi:hypothetical protein